MAGAAMKRASQQATLGETILDRLFDGMGKEPRWQGFDRKLRSLPE